MSQGDTADISMFFIRLVIEECCCECRLKYDSLFRIILGVISYIVLYTVFIVYRLDQIWEDGNKEFTLFFFIYSFFLFALPVAVAFYRSVRGDGSEQSLRFHMLIYRITEMHIDVAMFFYCLYLEDFQMTTLSMITTSLSVVNSILSVHGYIQLLRIVIGNQDNDTQVLLIMAMCSSWVVMPLFILFVGPVFLKRSCSWGCLRGCFCPDGCCCNECCCPNICCSSGCSCPNGCSCLSGCSCPNECFPNRCCPNGCSCPNECFPNRCCPNGCSCPNECFPNRCCPNGCSCPNQCCCSIGSCRPINCFGPNGFCGLYVCCCNNRCCCLERFCPNTARNSVSPDPTPPPLPPGENTRPISPRDNPLLPGYLVQEWIHKVYLYGGLINPRIVMAAADGIVKKYTLKSNDGNVKITKTNAESLLRRMGFVNRKSTKAINPLPEDFDVIKKGFIDNLKTLVVDHEVPDSLIMNWSQTVCHVVPGGDWAKEKKFTTRGMYANDQITLLLAVTKEGTLLPPQLIYSGKTESCVPKFPDSWDSTYTESCLSNEDTMIRYVEKVVIPYLKTVRESYPESKKAIAIFDESHSGEKLLKRLEDNGIVPVCVPSACCNKLQPLDLSVKRAYKEELKSQFHIWYSEQVNEKIDQQGDSKESAKNMIADLKISVLRPIHAEWIKSTHKEMEARKELIQTGFREIVLH